VTSDNDDGAAESTDVNEGELRSTGLAGTYYVGEGTGTTLAYDKLTLKANHTFTAEQGTKKIAGTWSTPARSKLVLQPTGGAETTLLYSISGAFLYLRTTFHGTFSQFIKDGVKYPTVDVGEVCSDKRGNITAECPDNFGCEYDGSDDPYQRCWPSFS
jgi:hypothetical protein